MGDIQKFKELKCVFNNDEVTYYMLDLYDFNIYFKKEKDEIIYCGKNELEGFNNYKWILNIFNAKEGDFYCKVIPK